MQYQKSILEDEISYQYPIHTVQLQGKKYIKVKDYMYDVNMVLGKGSYGTVYLGYAIEEGKDTKDLMKVAIKKIIIPVDVERKEEINKILKNTDTQLFALINFTNNMHIVRLYDFVRSEEEDAVYEILEYCNQKDLGSFLKIQRAKHPIIEIQIRYYFMQILKGFKDLHSKMFLHRDMKPQNILVNNGVIKIADFGFAQKFEEFGEKRVSFAGTVQTAAPQIVLHMPYTDKCDIYSLGVILYWMIYQKYPVKQITTKQDYLQPIAFPAEPEVSNLIKQLVKKMLEFEESSRITWEELFAHPLFDEQKILETFIIKPEVPKNQPIVERISSLRYTVKKRKIKDTVPDRASVWLAGLINKQYEIDEDHEKIEEKIRNKLKFQMGKVEVLRMITRTLRTYSPENKNIISLQSEQIIFLLQILSYAVQQLITFSVRKVKQEICFQTPVSIFNYQDLQSIKQSEQYKSLSQQCLAQLKIQQQKQKLILQNKAQLTQLTQKYQLSESINWILRPYNHHPKNFQKEMKRIIIELVNILKGQIVSADSKASKESIILVHHLFLLFMRDNVFNRERQSKISFNYFFEKEKYNEGEEGIEYLFMKVRELVQFFKTGNN